MVYKCFYRYALPLIGFLFVRKNKNYDALVELYDTRISMLTQRSEERNEGRKSSSY
jgi:hypothetical protein